MGRAVTQCSLAGSGELGCAAERWRRHDPASHPSHAFYVFLLKRSRTKAGSRRTGGASTATQAIETETPGITERVHVRNGHHDGAESRNDARCGPTNGPPGATACSQQGQFAWRNGAAIEPWV